MKVRTPRERFEQNPTRQKAIEAFCYDCMGAGQDSDWKKAIRHCTSPKCSLFTFRPYQIKEGK